MMGLAWESPKCSSTFLLKCDIIPDWSLLTAAVQGYLVMCGQYSETVGSISACSAVEDG